MSITHLPPADFTPTITGYTKQGAFRFWCQTVLPIVYDDSLSYYELLNKVVNYLNNTISDVASLENNFGDLFVAFNNLQDYVNNYFSSLDVQKEIDNKLDEMADNGELTRLVFQYLGYVTPEMYGAIGDGITDDTQAFLNAVNSGLPVLVTNSLIKDCGISSTKIICTNLILDGVLSIKDVDISGKIVATDNTQIHINRIAEEKHRDDSRIHDITIDCLSANPDNLIKITGTLFNVKIDKLTVAGKCKNVILIQAFPPDWITSITIINSMLGTSDNPIIIDGSIDYPIIKNVISQRYDAEGECRFITLKNRNRRTYIENSFMYDTTENDTQIYLDRGQEGDFYYGHKFDVCVIGRNAPGFYTSRFCKDSNGYYGYAIAYEVSNTFNNTLGDNIVPSPIKPATTGLNFKVNPEVFTSYGYMLPIGFSNTQSPINEPIIGLLFRFGTAYSPKSIDLFVGTNRNGELYTCKRDVDNNEWSENKYLYDAPTNLKFRTPSSKAITSLDSLDEYSYGEVRIDETISPSNSTAYFRFIKINNFIIATQFSNGNRFITSKDNTNTWKEWAQI